MSYILIASFHDSGGQFIQIHSLTSMVHLDPYIKAFFPLITCSPSLSHLFFIKLFQMSTQSILRSKSSSASTSYCEMVDSLEVGFSIEKQVVASCQQHRERSVRFSDVVTINNSAFVMVVNGSKGNQDLSAYQQYNSSSSS
ncbi:hypothetical protein J3Q64DRAFT_1696012 [Phycomyces blakesleeanus]|uniref:Uncharacterized protein n=2 Tax=Phycomyces blakesleeanus TaxID=4837 RepID=A0A162Q7L8_PHYB8|nr:hypothetical protein PHYBLDRAFT_61837 [Phycomyces blakesleeanus NRRL 1555(-)]OAD80786.1 hypothetical protein PHYBLDRAFT_61837 [Phycomyces blakesleeanus NRRL 1555(-)]|eukprot:XP_018298826.1 hypothetical protein PHYBLDRAFT_61837 [Phycomyces blakesleeanus NRRL 1555(-)]